MLGHEVLLRGMSLVEVVLPIPLWLVELLLIRRSVFAIAGIFTVIPHVTYVAQLFPHKLSNFLSSSLSPMKYYFHPSRSYNTVFRIYPFTLFSNKLVAFNLLSFLNPSLSPQFFSIVHVLAPFASDLRNIERFEKECTTFEPGDPFLPVEQLLAVFPTDSSHAIPKSSRWLMSDPESPIIDFYPKDVPVDPNGKAMPWLWVVLLPFVDESRLLDAVTSTRKGWTEKDRTANIRGPGDGLVFVHSSPMLAKKVVSGGDIGGRGELVGKLQKHPKSSNSGVSKVLNEFPLDAIDEIVFAVFEEPPACLHQSALNPKALPPPQSLRGIDFRLRRPRLNRGGENISQLAGASRPGSGSMNIGSYERSVASKAGRTVNATGTRPWGAMEPTNKKTDWGGRGGNQPQQLVAGSQNSKPLPVPYRDVRHGTSMRWQAPQPITQNHYAPPQHQKPQAYVQHQHQHQHQHNRRLPPPPPPRPQQQQQFQHQHQHQQQNQIQQQGQGKAIQWSSPPPVPTQNKQGYSFKGHVQKNSNQLGQGQGQPQPHHNQQQLQGHHQHTMHQNSHDGSQSSSRVDSKLISTLRSQLANTLQQNRQNRGS